MAWAQITYQNGKKSPFLPVKVYLLPSGEYEAEICSKPKPVVRAYDNYNGTVRTLMTVPRYKSDSAFCIAEEEVILEKLREVITKLVFSAKEVTVTYQRTANYGNAAQEQGSTNHSGRVNIYDNGDARRAEQPAE